MKKRALLAIMVFFAVGIYLYFLASPLITGNAIRQVASENSKDINVYFCAVENCTEVFKSLIKSSTKSIHCAIYDLTVPELIEDLKIKSNYVDVKILVDDSNFKKVKNLEFVRHDTDSQLSHNKVCIFDSSAVLTGSANPTRNIEENDNNVVVLKSVYLSQNYEQEFSELWNSEFGKGEKVQYPAVMLNGTLVENYFCPEDNCASHIIETLGKANESIYFMAFSFTHDEIGNKLIEKSKVGVEVGGVFEKNQLNEWSEFQKLKQEGIDARLDGNKYNMHHKVWIVDGQIVITGSMNPTAGGDSKNDENIIIIHDRDIASMFLAEFERVFGNAI